MLRGDFMNVMLIPTSDRPVAPERYIGVHASHTKHR